MRLILEPRFLFDASVAAATHRTHDLAHNNTTWESSSSTGASSHTLADHADHASGTQAPDGQNLWTPGAAAGASSFAHSHETSVASVLFVDPRVANWQTLANGVTPGTDVIVIDPNKDGLAQVTAALKGLRDVQSVNFLTYGTPGQLELGATPVTDATLLASAHEIAGWRDHLADNAQIQLWGCDVGAGTAGATFVSDLHALTGAGVAAATNAIGDSALGGDWTLDRTAGAVTPVAPFTAAAMASYQGVLDYPVPTVTFVSSAPQALLGGTFQDVVAFSNTALAAVGYGPVIEVVAPDNSTESATLSSATYLGITLPVSSVPLSTSVPGHVGVLGALDPVMVDTSGNPVFDAAPAGAVAGDQLYVIQLPFGSYSPGQPAANVTLTFSTTDASQLTAQSGQPVNIDAIGGFIYGASAVNDPANHPSIQGINNGQGSFTSAAGLQTASTPLVLYTITTSVATQPGDGETATGPDFPGSYNVTITPAPAVTAGNPILDSSLTTGPGLDIPLPGDIQYNGGAIGVSGSGGTVTMTPSTTVPGGDVLVHLNPVSAPTTVSIPFYVPQYDASGNSILDPTTGAPTGITIPPPTFAGGWTPSAPGPYTFTDSSAPPVSFTARSLAVQLTALDTTIGSTTQTYPEDTVTYTVNFEVSDYFTLNDLSVQTQLNDGLTIDPGYAPQLTLTPRLNPAAPPSGLAASTVSDLGVIIPTSVITQPAGWQDVNASGSNADWNFSFDNATGQTVVNLNPPPATLTPGEIGSLAYEATVLDKYTVSYSQASITEGDSVSSTTVGQAYVGANAITDTSTAVLTVPVGSGTVDVVAVDGVATGGGTPTVDPGDTVTYEITRTLSTGDYEALDLSAYLPLPVISAADPLADGGSVAAYTLAPGGAEAAPTFYPTAGDYSYFVSSWNPITPLPPLTIADQPSLPAVQSALVKATSNSVDFAFAGPRDDPTNPQNGTVHVYFTVTVSNAPFADGLDLTALGSSSLTSGSLHTNTAEGISQITVNEPKLTGGIKDGVVSLVDNGLPLTPKPSAVFTLDGTSTVEDPTTYYEPAGTYSPAGAGSLFLSGNGPGSIGDLQNLNVSGADGSDTVRIVTTIQNSGHSGAWDIDVSDLLPSGYSAGDVVAGSVVVVRSGTGTILVPETGETLMDLFTPGGVTLWDPNRTLAHPNLFPTLYSVLAPGNGNVMTISFDLTLHPGQSAGSVLTNTANIVNYTNIAGGPGFVTGGNPVGGSAADLVDTATITTTSPALTRSYGASLVPNPADSIAGTPVVTVGDPRLVELTLSVPEGGLYGAGPTGDVTVTDQLAANESFYSFVSITAGAGITLTPPTPPYTLWSVSGSTVTFDLGPTVLNSTSDHGGGAPDGAQTITIEYYANFGVEGTYLYQVPGTNAYTNPNNGATYTNTAALSYSGTPISNVKGTTVERDPVLTGALTDTLTPGVPLYSGEQIDYTYTITDTGVVESQDTQSLLELAAGLTYDPGSLNIVPPSTDASSPSVDDSDGLISPGAGLSGSLNVGAGTLSAGGSITYTFSATVKMGLAAGTDLTVYVPAAVSGTPASFGRSISASVAPVSPATGPATIEFQTQDTHQVAVITPSFYFSAEANGTTPAALLPGYTGTLDMTVGDIARLHGVAEIAEGQNNNVVLDFTLPAGFVYTADGTVTLALVSPSGDFSTTEPGLSGVGAPLQVTNSAVSNVATFVPTFVVPSTAIDTTSVPGHLLINLGTLSNDDGVPLPNYAIVEFNAQVQNVAGNHQGVSLTDGFVVQANGVTPISGPQLTEMVEEPHVTIAKTVTSINYTASQATFQITLDNTGPVTAYDVALTDPYPGNVSSQSPITLAGGGLGVVVTPGGGNVFAATMTLPAGAVETFTYTLTVTSASAPVPPTTTTETYQDINPSVTGLTYGGVTSAIGAAGSTTGSRDGAGLPVTTALNSYFGTVTTSLGAASGQVWQALGDTPQTYDPSIDTALAGVLVTGNFVGGLTETVTTDGSGDYTLGLIPNGAFTVTLPSSGSGGLPGSETLVVNAYGSLTPPAVANTLPPAAGTAIAGVNFVYEKPDTAPVLGNWASGAQTAVPGQILPLSTTGTTTAVDAELNKLMGPYPPPAYSYNNGVLTLERYVSGAPAPNAADVFGGDSQLTLSGGAVIFQGTIVGSFTEAGGVLQITFNTNASAATVQGVMDDLTWSNATHSATASTITIGATLSDGNFNNVPLATGSTGQQGTGGVMTSAPVFSTFTLQPSTPIASLYFAAEANGTTPVAPGTAADIDMTVGDIARLHGVAQLTEGDYSNMALVFTLPAGFVYTNDSTVTLALVSPNADISTTEPGLSGPGLQVTNSTVTTAGGPTVFKPSFVVPSSAISVVGNVLTINLGNIANSDGSGLPNYAIVEINGQVQNVASNTNGAVLTDNFAVQADGATTPAVSRSETVEEPDVTLAKTVTAINEATGQATYQIMLDNTGPVTAYDVALIDPYPASNVASVSAILSAGGASGLSVTTGFGNIFAATMTLPAGAVETFTYTLTVTSLGAPVPATTTTETYQDLNPSVAGLTYGGVTSTFGAAGSLTGSRNGAGLPDTSALNNYFGTVTTSLGAASGQVWQALGDTPQTYDSSIDTPLANVIVTGQLPDGLTATVMTDVNGDYTIGLIPNGAFTVTLPSSGSGGLPGSETLVVNAFGNLTPPATTTPPLTAAGAAIPGVNFVYELPDTPPVIGNWATGSQTATPGVSLLLSNTDATTAFDAQLNTLIGAHPATYSFNGGVLTLERYVSGSPSPNTTDEFGGDSLLTLTGSTVTFMGVDVGSFTQAGGALQITFNGNANAATVQGMMDHLTWSSATTGTFTLNITIGATLTDGNFNNVPLAAGFTGAQGTGGVMTSAPVFSVFTLLPAAAPYTVTYTEPNNTPEAGVAVALPALNLANAVEPGATFSSVTLSLTGGAVPAQDVLTFSPSPAYGNITATFNAATDTLTLTSAGDTATLAQWQAAMGGVQYYDSSPQPHTATRIVNYTFVPTVGDTVSEPVGAIFVNATDDSPIINTSTVLSLPHATEGASGAPAGAVGELVSALANAGDISDLDGNDAHDGSAPGPYGMAIVFADTTLGNWWFSTNNGASWTEFAGAGLAAISQSNALHLVADGSTRIYFQPIATNFTGEITPALTFRAWDLFDGVANGTLSALPTDVPFATGINKLASAYSADTLSVPLMIDPAPPVITNPVFTPLPLFPPGALGLLSDLGGLPPGWLVGSDVYHTLLTDVAGSLNVSADAFYGTEASQRLTYEAGTAGGGPLPPWLSFDSATLTFTGTPPESAAGTLDLRILARDQEEHTATAEVHLFITRDATNPLLMMRTLQKLQPHNTRILPLPPLPLPPPPQPPQHTGPPANAPPHGRQVFDVPAAAPGRAGLGAQLREQTLAGRLARTRAMLSALSGAAA